MTYQEIRKKILDFNKNESDNSFVVLAIIYNCSHLLEDVNELISIGKMSFAYPILRQIYEYIILLMAFDYQLTNMDAFAQENNDDSYIRNLKNSIFRKVLEEHGLKKHNEFKEIMNSLWKVLCERTHANFDRLLLQSYEYDELLSKNENLKKEAVIAFRILDSVFQICAHYVLEEDGKKDYSIFRGKKVKFDSDIKIAKSSTGIVERLLECSKVKSVFILRFKKLKEDMDEIRPLIERLKNE